MENRKLKEVKNFTDLEIYQLAEKIALKIEKLCRGNLKLAKQWKSVDHIIESAVSIGSNIAEAFGRYFFRESINFFYYGRGSLCETERRLRHFWLSGYFNDEEKKEAEEIFQDLKRLNVKINNTILSTRRQITINSNKSQQITTNYNKPQQ